MSRKSKKEISERPRSRINQFIIECLFSKYFEEEEEIGLAQDGLGTPSDISSSVASVVPSGLSRNND